MFKPQKNPASRAQDTFNKSLHSGNISTLTCPLRSSRPFRTHSKRLLMNFICSQFDLTGYRLLAANKTTSDYFRAATDQVSCLRQQGAAVFRV